MSECLHYFQAATLLFYQNKLQESLQAINRSIDLKPANSISYSNRALIKYHLGRVEEAKEDLSISISLNPLNYMAYFNLSSIHLRLDNFYAFIRNISCAISALKLIVGRRQRQKIEIVSSLQICKNNFDAFLVLVLMEIQRQNFKGAQAIIQKYGQFQRDNKFVNILRQKITSLNVQYSLESEEELYQILQRQVKKEPLKCSIEFEKSIIQEQFQQIIRQKIEQFNKYYTLVNKQMGKVNHVPKTNEKYILMDEISYQKGRRNYSFHTQTQMIASH